MPLTGRIIGLDLGEARIGVAVSDPLGIIAQPHSVITSSSPQDDIAAITRIVDEMNARAVVVGLPLNQQGKPGPQAQKVLAFVEALRHKLGAVEVVTQDERFSTAEAQRALLHADVSRKKRKKAVDKIAAQMILQTYMERQRRARRE